MANEVPTHDGNEVFGRDVDPLRGEARDPLTNDAAWHDLVEPRKIDRVVDRKAVHRTTTAQTDADGSNLSRSHATRFDQDTRFTREPFGIDTELGE